MEPTRMYPTACYVLVGILTACTTGGPAPPAMSSPTPVVTQSTSQIRASDRMFYWHEEAQELHTMAMHREREAELMLRKTSGPTTHKFVKHMRQLAHQLHQAATYADVQAKEAEREIPPDMLQQFPSALR
jgi:hypothetical protein